MNLDRLKRRMIRDAVQENLDTIEGHSPRAGSRRTPVTFVARGLFWCAASGLIVTAILSMADASARPEQKNRGEREAAPIAVSSPSDVGRWSEPAQGEVIEEQAFVRPESLARTILPLAVRTIVLDPGHGGDNRGTISPAGQVEKEITLDVARRLQSLLEEASYRVVLTRSADTGLSLRDRAELANSERGDVFVSIHVNWIDNAAVRGVETYYLGPTDDPYLEALAARENQQSGYSIADLRSILDEVYVGVRRDESRRLAVSIQEALFGSLHKVNATVRNRGVKTAPFGVLTSTEMPAILAEVSCASNEVEAQLLLTPIYRQYLAQALFEGIDHYSRDLAKTGSLAG